MMSETRVELPWGATQQEVEWPLWADQQTYQQLFVEHFQEVFFRVKFPQVAVPGRPVISLEHVKHFNTGWKWLT